MSDFVDGLFLKPKHQNAPDFVLCKGSINRDKMLAFLQSADDWVNFDVKLSKDGQKVIATIDNWKPQQDAHNTAKSNGYQPQAEDIPFN